MEKYEEVWIHAPSVNIGKFYLDSKKFETISAKLFPLWKSELALDTLEVATNHM